MNSFDLPSDSLSDAQLWKQLREGEKTAYITIYEQYSDVLYQYGAKFTSNHEMLLDCLHDLFLDLWDRKHRLGATDSIKYYLFRSLRRRIAQSVSKWNPITDEAHLSSADATEFQWVTDEAVNERKSYLKQAIAKLPERQREAIYLRFYNNFSFEEIAGIMKIDIRSAYNLTYKALGQLRNSLSPHHPFLVSATLIGLLMLIAKFL